MTKIRVGLGTGDSKVIDIQKPYDYINYSDIQEKLKGKENKRIIGWCKIL